MSEGQQEAAADLRLEVRRKLNEAYELALPLAANAEDTWTIVYKELDDLHDDFWTIGEDVLAKEKT